MNAGRSLSAFAIVCAIASFGLGGQISGQSMSHSARTADTSDDGVAMTVEGLVRDVACPMQNHKSTATHFNMDCALACARAGSPLVILTRKDELYFPITDEMPDASQREKLMPYVGKFVRVTGQVRRRNGTRTIVIKSISEMENVKLDSKLEGD